MMKKRLLAIAACILSVTVFLSAKESPDITVFRPAVNPRDKNSPMVRAAARYKKEYGGKVTFVLSDWNNWQTKVLTYMASGDPIDVIFAGDSEFPRFYVKGYLQPIEDYVDLNKPYIDMKSLDDCYKFGGHYYIASQNTSNHYHIVIYNKTLMDEEGIPENEQPSALYKDGDWDWDHLRNLARKLTKDTTGSGSIDRWGFANWWTEGFIYMNGTTLTKVDDNGNTALNFDDQAVTEALSFLENAKKEGWYLQDYNIARDGIQKRTVAMYLEREYYPAQILDECRDELGYVPLPVGPGNKNPRNLFECDGYGIGKGSDSPTYAGKFIDICLEEWYKDDLNGHKKWPEEIFDLTEEVSKHKWYPAKTSNAVSSILSSFLGEVVWSGNSPATAIAKYEPKAAALVADANKPMTKLEKLDFKAVNLNFRKKSQTDLFRIMYPDTMKSVSVAYVNGQEAIDKNGSLKITMDPSVDGEDIAAVITDTDKLSIVGWRDYIVEFDVKTLKEPGEGAYVYLKAYADDLNQYGWITKTIDEAETVFHVKGYIRDVLQNGKIPICIGGHNLGDIVIDNLSISEK